MYTRIDELLKVREELRALPQIDAPPDAWGRIAARLRSDAEPRVSRRLPRIVAAASLAGIALAIALTVMNDSTPVATPAVLATATAVRDAGAAPLAQLVSRSQQLEQLLQVLPQRPHIERVAAAATIDTIEQRIQWLDFQLSYAADSELGEAQAQRLWSERVDLMDSLIKVRYAEAERQWF